MKSLSCCPDSADCKASTTHRNHQIYSRHLSKGIYADGYTLARFHGGFKLTPFPIAVLNILPLCNIP